MTGRRARIMVESQVEFDCGEAVPLKRDEWQDSWEKQANAERARQFRHDRMFTMHHGDLADWVEFFEKHGKEFRNFLED